MDTQVERPCGLSDGCPEVFHGCHVLNLVRHEQIEIVSAQWGIKSYSAVALKHRTEPQKK